MTDDRPADLMSALRDSIEAAVLAAKLRAHGWPDVPPQPGPDERPTLGRCGIYDVDRLNLIEWAHGGVHHARCSICSATFTHHRRDSAVELYLAHIAGGGASLPVEPAKCEHDDHVQLTGGERRGQMLGDGSGWEPCVFGPVS